MCQSVMSVLQHRPRLVSGVKGCGLGRPGLLRMSQDHCYFGLRDLTGVSCWSNCFSGVSLDVSSFVCDTISPAAFVSPLLWDCSSRCT